MKSWAAANPAKPLKSVDITQPLERFWWCKKCHRVTEPIDVGDPWPQCVHCHGRSLVMQRVTPERAPKPPPQPLPPGEHAHELFAKLKEVVA